jgi:hypothetical protein
MLGRAPAVAAKRTMVRFAATPRRKRRGRGRVLRGFGACHFVAAHRVGQSLRGVPSALARAFPRAPTPAHAASRRVASTKK